LDPLPASTGIQAILCRPDLLIEIEAMVIFDSSGRGSEPEHNGK
jgi:2-iminobutanoate/2-iminopropanoate deaminase